MANRSIRIFKDDEGVTRRIQESGEPIAGVRQLSDISDPISLQQNINQLLQPQQTFDLESNPIFKAAQQQAEAQAARQSALAQEELNRRGILDSTITGETLGDIGQQATQAVTAAIPQIIAQQEAIRQRDLSNLLGAQEAQAQQQANEAAAKAAAEKQKYDRAVAKWKNTGFVTNDIAATLGLEPGTKHSAVLEADKQREFTATQNELKRRADLAEAAAKGASSSGVSFGALTNLVNNPNVWGLLDKQQQQALLQQIFGAAGINVQAQPQPVQLPSFTNVNDLPYISNQMSALFANQPDTIAKITRRDPVIVRSDFQKYLESTNNTESTRRGNRR